MTDDERAAVLAIGRHVTALGTALGEIGTLAQNFENTDSWKIRMATQIAVVRSEHEALLNLDVPPKIGALRAAVLNATTDCNSAMDKLVSGLDRNRMTDIQAASKLMVSCGEKIQTAKPELDALTEQT